MSLFSSKSQAQIEKLTEENDELKNTLHTVLQKHTSHMELESKIEDSKKELARLSDIQKDLEENIQNLNLDKVEKTQELDSVKSEIDAIEQKKIALQEEIDAIKIEPKLEEIKKLEEQIESLKQDENELSETISKLKTEEAKKAVLLRNFDERISLSDEVKTNLDTSMNTIVQLISDKEKEHAELTDKIEQASQEFMHKQNEMLEFDRQHGSETEKLRKMEEETTALEQKKIKLLDEIRNAEIIKSQINEDILTVKDKEEEFVHKLNEIKEQILEEEKKKLEVEESHLQVENSLSETMRKFIDELNDAKTKLNTTKQEIHEKEKILNEKEKILLEKSFQIAEYGGLNKVLQKEKAATEEMITGLKTQQKELSDNVAELKDKEAEQKILLNKIRTEHDAIKSKKEELEKRFKEFLDITNNSYSEAEKRNELLSSELKEKTTQVEDIKSRIEKEKDEVRKLKEEFSKIDLLKEEHTAKVTELIAQEKNLQKKISDLEQQINDNK